MQFLVLADIANPAPPPAPLSRFWQMTLALECHRHCFRQTSPAVVWGGPNYINCRVTQTYLHRSMYRVNHNLSAQRNTKHPQGISLQCLQSFPGSRQASLPLTLLCIGPPGDCFASSLVKDLKSVIAKAERTHLEVEGGSLLVPTGSVGLCIRWSSWHICFCEVAGSQQNASTH